jgi:hypothetical protein
MTRKAGRWMRGFLVPVLAIAAGAAHADPVTSDYVVKGSMAAAWGIGNRPGTEAILFAFRELAPRESETPASGPRLTFSITQWSFDAAGWVRRQWFGDAPLEPEMFKIGTGLSEATVEATVSGTLEARSETGASVSRDVPGKVQIRWGSGYGGVGNSVLAYIYQTPSYTAKLQSQGTGRSATASITVAVDALGEPMTFWGFGSITNVREGALAITMP